jgi:hypothetical protein
MNSGPEMGERYLKMGAIDPNSGAASIESRDGRQSNEAAFLD